MRAGVWFVAGAAAGVYGMVRARRAAEALTPEGLSDRANALRLGARLFREEVAQGRIDAEVELRQRLQSLAAGEGPHELQSSTPRPIESNRNEEGHR